MATLKRALGRWDLTAIGVNQVIGGSIFLLPSQVAIIFGAWSAIAVAAMGLVSLSVALCFAELASRFDGTGGPYLYTRTAFGNFFGFEVTGERQTLIGERSDVFVTRALISPGAEICARRCVLVATFGRDLPQHDDAIRI